MKHFVLSEHSTFCTNDIPLGDNAFCCRHICETQHMLFQFNFDFYLITYPQCLNSLDHLGFKENILNQLTKKFETDKISRSVVWNEEFVLNNDLRKLTNSKIEEICYLYCDNSGKTYMFTNKIQYIKVLSIDYYKNINKAEDEIKEMFSNDIYLMNSLIKQLKTLMYKNAIEISNTNLLNSKKIKLIDLLTKKINEL